MQFSQQFFKANSGDFRSGTSQEDMDPLLSTQTHEKEPHPQCVPLHSSFKGIENNV